MAESIELKAAARADAGKSSAQALRREGRVPAVIYGDDKAPESISIDYRQLWKHFQTGHFLSHVITLDVGGRKTRVLPREVQLDKVRDFPIHVDFLRVSRGAKIDVAVAVHFVNEADAPGLKRGGVLNIVEHEIHLTCPADAIPDIIEIDLTGLEIGDSIHISQIKLPAGVTPTVADRDFTVATVIGSAAVLAEEGEAADGAEGEASR
jgi:large subunit ribosomal protein L25